MRYKSLHWGASALAIACAMQAAPSLAQDGDGGISLDPITIFATLSPIAAFDYPGQVTVVERERIEDLQPSSLSDLFDGVPAPDRAVADHSRHSRGGCADPARRRAPKLHLRP